MHSALLVALPLAFTVALGSFRMGQPVVLLVTGMSLTPLPTAVANHLVVFGISFDLLLVVISSALPLAVGTATHKLVGTKPGRLEELLAITATAIIHQVAPNSEMSRPL